MLSPTGTNYHSIYTLTDPSGFRRTSFNSIAFYGNTLFVAGDTTWSGFPAIAGAAQTQFGGIRDGLMMRLALDGTVMYSTFLGGSGSEAIADIAIDQAGAAYAVGDTSATDTICDPSQPLHQMRVTKLTADGSSVAYASNLSYQFGACLLPPIRIVLDVKANAYTVGCGHGGAAGLGCTLWKVGPTGIPLMFPDVPWNRFTVDTSGASKWYAPVSTGLDHQARVAPGGRIFSRKRALPLPFRNAPRLDRSRHGGGRYRIQFLALRRGRWMDSGAAIQLA